MTENDLAATGMWTPKRLVVVLLCLFMPPMAFMYLGKKYWAWVYLLLVVAVIAMRLLWFPLKFNDDMAWLQIPVPLMALFHAYHLAKPMAVQRPWFSHWYGLVGVFLVCTIPFLGMRVFLYENFRIPAGSMLPTLQVGQIIHVKKWGCGNYQYLGIHFWQTEPTAACELQRGDLIVFDFPLDRSTQYVKRVMAMGGDHIRIEDKQVWLNGQLLPAEWMSQEDSHAYWQETLGDMQYQVIHIDGRNVPFRHVDVKVPAGHLFVMGDNRDNSHDSRVWGVVPIDHVVGVVF